MHIEALIANYIDKSHKNDLQSLINMYARDPMGGGEPLDKKIVDNVVTELSKLGHAFSVLVYADGKAVGFANCFELFSTFLCKPLINIHDLAIIDSHRGLGISRIILQKIEDIAIENGCCKVTLEVLIKNDTAKAAYSKFGFSDYSLKADTGVALFWQKII